MLTPLDQWLRPQKALPTDETGETSSRPLIVTQAPSTSPISDRGITKCPESDTIQSPGMIRTRSGRTVQLLRLNDSVYNKLIKRN